MVKRLAEDEAEGDFKRGVTAEQLDEIDNMEIGAPMYGPNFPRDVHAFSADVARNPTDRDLEALGYRHIMAIRKRKRYLARRRSYPRRRFVRAPRRFGLRGPIGGIGPRFDNASYTRERNLGRLDSIVRAMRRRRFAVPALAEALLAANPPPPVVVNVAGPGRRYRPPRYMRR